MGSLRAMVHPRFYAAQPGIPSDLVRDDDRALPHFLTTGAHHGARVTALFHPDTYRRRLDQRDIPLPPDGAPFFHWLTVGWDLQVVPTLLFDEEYYVAQPPRARERSGLALRTVRPCRLLCSGAQAEPVRPDLRQRRPARRPDPSGPGAAGRHAPPRSSSTTCASTAGWNTASRRPRERSHGWQRVGCVTWSTGPRRSSR